MRHAIPSAPVTQVNSASTLLLQRAPLSMRILSLFFALTPVMYTLTRPQVGPVGGYNRVIRHAAMLLVNGHSPYDTPRFLYLPSAVIAALPQTLVSDRTAEYVMHVVLAGCVLGGWWAATRIFGFSASSWAALIPLWGLSVFFPYASDISLSNWTAIAALALPVALLLATRERWVWAGVVLGLSIAIKPMLVPVALVFLFAGELWGLAAMIAVPAVLNLLAVMVVPQPALFMTKTLPFILRGQDSHVSDFDASLQTVLPRLGIPRPVVLAAAVVIVVTGLTLAFLRWRRSDDQRLRLVETTGLVMVTVFLVSRPVFGHYALVIVPMLMSSVFVARSAARHPAFLAALTFMLSGVVFPYLTASRELPFRYAIVFGLIFVALGAAAVARKTSMSTAVAVPAQRDRAPSYAPSGSPER